MKKFLNFLSTTKQPENPHDTLIAFLTQCREQGFHFVFPPSMDKHQLQVLIKPLNLAPQDADALLNEHVSPLSSFTLGSCALFTAMRQQKNTTFPCQVCDNCAPGLFEHYGYDVAQTTWCSQCHEKRECLDMALIEHYRKHDIDDETIRHQLPKTRWNSDSPTYQSIEDIEAVYQSVFEAARQNTNA